MLVLQSLTVYPGVNTVNISLTIEWRAPLPSLQMIKKNGNCSQCYLYQISIFLCSHTLSIHIPVSIFSELSPSYVHLFPFSNLCLSQCICWIQTPPQPFFTHFYPHLPPDSTKALPLPNYHIKLCLLASVSHCCVRTYPFPSLHSFSSDFVSTFHLLFCSPS